jgi:hypothetical protein
LRRNRRNIVLTEAVDAAGDGIGKSLKRGSNDLPARITGK